MRVKPCRTRKPLRAPRPSSSETERWQKSSNRPKTSGRPSLRQGDGRRLQGGVNARRDERVPEQIFCGVDAFKRADSQPL